MVEKKLEDMAWDDDALHRIFFQCALYSFKRKKLDVAESLYNSALLLKEDDYIALYQRSRCRRQVANTETSLADSKAAMKLAPKYQPINLELCDALFELNQFEECDLCLHTYSRKFLDSSKVNAFYDREIVVEQVLGSVLGDSLLRFFMENEHILKTVEEDYQRRTNADPRPQWKILRDEGKCDLFSYLEKMNEAITPCEMARRDLSFKLFIQIYLNKNWSDFIFLKDLLSNPVLLLTQAKDSAKFLKKFIEIKNNIIWKFLKMLHTRCPIYTKKAEKCPILKICEKQREAHLFRVQNETRRRMFIVLHSIRKFRNEKNLKALSQCVEDTVCNFILLKTRRVLCWKFVFINEVLNIFALAHLDQYEVIDSINEVEPNKRLQVLFGFSDEHSIQEYYTAFVFGDKSTFQDYGKYNDKLNAYRNRVIHLEKIKRFFEYPIVRAYMDFEIARIHLQQSRIDECCTSARKSINEAEKAANNTWKFLGLMLTAKAHAKLERVERLHETLTEAKIAADHIKCKRLQRFLAVAYETNNVTVIEKENRRKSTMQSLSSRRSMKSRMSSYAAK